MNQMNGKVIIPGPKLNGGLYTGERFAQGAAYANFPATPDVDYLTHVNLKSANPPPGALIQYPGTVRDGNNYQEMPGINAQGQGQKKWCSEGVCSALSTIGLGRSKFYSL